MNILLLLHTTLLLPLLLLPLPSKADDPPCRTECGSLQIQYPFGIDDGCGAPQFRHMLTCNASSTSLFFVTPNGNYKVQSIDYKAQTLTVYDPDMSTCTILQPHHDLVLSDLQYAVIPPSPDTVFALFNCSVDSPLLHRYRSLCFDLPGHVKCQDLYSSCSSFKVFTSGNGISTGWGPPPAAGNINNGLPPPVPPTMVKYIVGNDHGYGWSPPPASVGSFNNGWAPPLPPPSMSSGNGNSDDGSISNGQYPPCCFTGYSTVKVMSLDILDCTHFTSFYNVDKLRGVGPMDWSYGVKFSYSVPDMGCEMCMKSGGSCGFDAQTEVLLCLCSRFDNSTRECGGGDMDAGKHLVPSILSQALITIGLGVLFLLAPPCI